jgi:hypothetical protein
VLEYVESVLLVPHSNQAVVALPLGLTDPFSVAVPEVTELAAVVVTTGKTGAGAVVVKFHEPDHALVPPILEALTRQ